MMILRRNLVIFRVRYGRILASILVLVGTFRTCVCRTPLDSFKEKFTKCTSTMIIVSTGSVGMVLV